MTKYILRRLGLAVITLFILIFMIFFMMHLIPGGPFTSDRGLSPAVEEALNAKYHLDKPFMIQFKYYMQGLVKGDLGVSYQFKGKDVSEFITQGFPLSGKLGLVTLIFVLLASIPMGILSALKNGRWQDMLIMSVAVIGVTIPSFVIATMLMYFFSYKLGALPTFGMSGWKSYVLPVLALGGYHVSFLSRLMRSSLLEVMGQDYIRTARSKGVSEFQTIFRHALRNALIPLITVLGPTIANLVTGSFVIESIFALPGLGVHFVSSVSNRDYSTVMGITIFYATFLISIIIIVDMFYCVIDPRIKYE